MNSKARFAVMTDHPVINSIALRDTMKYFMIHGLSDVDSINAMTHPRVNILGVDDEEMPSRKIASLVVKDPFHFSALSAVLAEGKIIRK